MEAELSPKCLQGCNVISQKIKLLIFSMFLNSLLRLFFCHLLAEVFRWTDM
jgi:hypothetical protein